jgi:hypothetical protein
VNETRTPVTPAQRAGLANEDDALTRMLRAVERIADTVSSIGELAIKLTPGTLPAAGWQLDEDEQIAVAYVRHSIAIARHDGRASEQIPVAVLVLLLGAIDRRTAKS